MRGYELERAPPGILGRFGASVERVDDGLRVTGHGRISAVDLDLHDAGELAPVVAAICAFAFMRVFGRIVMEANRVKAPSGPPRSAAWHLLHTPTRVLLREYHIARPNGTLGRYLSLFYIMGGAAVIIFVADVWTLLRP